MGIRLLYHFSLRMFTIPVNVLMESLTRDNKNVNLSILLEKQSWYNEDHQRKIPIMYLQRWWTDENLKL